MLTKEKVERINELANKKKTMTLTEEECDEQQTLRAEYIQAVRQNLREQLDTIVIVDEPQCDVENPEEVHELGTDSNDDIKKTK